MSSVGFIFSSARLTELSTLLQHSLGLLRLSGEDSKHVDVYFSRSPNGKFWIRFVYASDRYKERLGSIRKTPSLS